MDNSYYWVFVLCWVLFFIYTATRVLPVAVYSIMLFSFGEEETKAQKGMWFAETCVFRNWGNQGDLILESQILAMGFYSNSTRK